MNSETVYFGIVLSIVTYLIGQWINKKTGLVALNPLLISIVLIIIILKGLGIEYDAYNMGGSMISFFLGPATVLLAIPLFKSLQLLKKNMIPVFFGVIVGSLTSIVSVVLLSKLFGLEDIIIKSFLPKSVTTPIGIELSNQLGGIPSLTVAMIVATGIVGAIIGERILKLFKVKDEISIGVAFGTAAHAIGTSKALEIGKVPGAFSGLSIGLMGIATSIFLSLFKDFILSML